MITNMENMLQFYIPVQLVTCIETPSQGFPPWAGGGSLHCLCWHMQPSIDDPRFT